MNKIASIAVTVALTSAFSFSQEQEYGSPQEQEYIPPQEQEYIPPQEQEYRSPQEYKYNPPQKYKNEEDKSSTELGGRIAINFITQALQLDSASGNSFGLGFVVGGIKRLPIIKNVLFFSPGFDIMYRNVCDECTLNTSIGPVKFQDVYELALGVPLLIQLEIIKLYIEGGIQFDLPIFQYVLYDASYGTISKIEINRETFDFGYLVGLGWKVDEKVAVGLKGIYSITGKYGEKEKPKKLIQGGLTFVFSL